MAGNIGDVRAPLRGAIIGLGNVAIHAHLPVWRKSADFNIEAIVEPSPERAKIGKELLPRARIYPDMGSLLSEETVDFVDICTPPCFHSELVRAACGSGLHVLCEKPLAMPPEQLEEIRQLTERTQKVVFIVNNWKYAPLWAEVAELIETGRIGTVRSVSLNVLRKPNSGGGVSNWRKSIEIAQGGILIDHGWHNLYLVLSFLRKYPYSMTVRMEPSPENGARVEETVDLRMRFHDAEASLHLTWQADCRRNQGTIVGSRGVISVNDDHLILHPADSDPTRIDFSEPLSAGSHHSEWMEPVVRNFSREIKDIHQRGTNLREARWCSYLIDLAYRANREATGVIEVSDRFMEAF